MRCSCHSDRDGLFVLFKLQNPGHVGDVGHSVVNLRRGRRQYISTRALPASLQLSTFPAVEGSLCTFLLCEVWSVAWARSFMRARATCDSVL